MTIREGPSRWRALGALLRPDAARWGALGFLLAASSALLLLGPVLIRVIIDDAASGATADHLARLAMWFLVIAVLRQALAVVVAWFATTSAWRTTNGLRLRMAEHVLGLDHEFHRTHTPGELIQRVDGDVTSVSDFLGQVVPKATAAILVTVGAVAAMTIVDWRIGVALVIYLTIAVVAILSNRHRAVTESSDEMGSYARLYGGIEERLTAAEDLRTNGAGAHAMHRFVHDSSATLHSAVRREKAFLRMWWCVELSSAAGTVLSLVLGALLVEAGTISLGTAFLLFQYLLLLERPLEEVIDQLETVQKASGAMVRVVDLLALRPTIVDRGTVEPPAGALAVRFEHVSFDYGDDQTVLHDVHLELGAGRSVGVVGRTGSGKTTASRLVLRLVEPTSGRVLLGGVPIEDIPMSSLRRRVALIPQEVELFSGTVRDNVTLFDPEPSDAAVEHALERAGLATLVAGGIHRELGAAGAGLSAGEAQLLAFARVWLREPDLVVLDEATARIDPETERRLDAAVQELMHGRTTIVIAHRLSTLRKVDEIVVFDHGRIAEHGERAHLAAAPDSRFRQLLDLALDERGVA